ncbi:MAG: hypothetical protein EPN61_17605 [Burkholderiaceae bacterium]|nr:MAG: hypothetical protein EPN61_17605 [Burkholderiaceae bacterium]
MAIEKTKAAEQSEAPADEQALSSEAAARRHMLLKGLGKGSAVLAASIPLKALATLPPTSVFTNPGANGAPVVRCGISGMTSGVHSQDTTTNVCSGYSPGYYTQREHWPSGLNPDALVTTVFPSCKLMVNKAGTALGNYRVPTLLEVMNLTPRAPVPEFHWIAAWVNAMGGAPSSWNFPYTGAQIQAFYAGTGPYTKAQALTFIETYLEIHP